jgi:hypothetical protein
MFIEWKWINISVTYQQVQMSNEITSISCCEDVKKTQKKFTETFKFMNNYSFIIPCIIQKGYKYLHLRNKHYLNTGLLGCNSVDMQVNTNVWSEHTAFIFSADDGWGSMFTCKAGIQLQVHTASQPRRPTPTYSTPWKPCISNWNFISLAYTSS